MKVLAVIDSFKGTLTSKELGTICKNVLNEKQIETDYIAISDGGEGFLDAIEQHIDAQKVYVDIHNVFNKKMTAYYLTLGNKAFIESAKVCGIDLLSEDELNPFEASTFGIGELINDCISKNKKEIIVGLGGTSTNDMGIGLLEALGVLFFDTNKNKMTKLTPSQFHQIESIDFIEFNQRIKDVQITILSDVDNPLLGLSGATYTFGTQKGIKAEDLKVFNQLHLEMSEKIVNVYKDKRNSLGAGSAGGLGFCFLQCFQAELQLGIDFILKMMDFENLSKQYDFIITGEGKLDTQSLHGKVIYGIIKRAEPKKVIIVTALNLLDETTIKMLGVYKVKSIVPLITTKEDSLKNPKEAFEQLVKTLF